MATIEFINRKNKTYEAMKRVINYITRSDKTEEDLVYGNLCNKDNAYDDFVQLKQMYGKEKIQRGIWFGKDLKDRYSVLWLYGDLFLSDEEARKIQ